MSAMPEVDQVAEQMSRVSVDKAWDVERAFDWPAQLDPELWCMSPELVSVYGTGVWAALSEPQRRQLAFHELVNFFSVVLQGEKPLVQGLAQRLYSRHVSPAVTAYLHHFIDEENKHMVMFGRFCQRYAGKVYPDKKVQVDDDYAPGEEEIVFFEKVLVVEELGDFYNCALMRDERVVPIVRELNRVHHVDEARHLAFGRAHLRALWQRWTPLWTAAQFQEHRDWLHEYVRLCLADFYNPMVYFDAGLGDGFVVRRHALGAQVCIAHRRTVAARLLKLLLEFGILTQEPPL